MPSARPSNFTDNEQCGIPHSTKSTAKQAPTVDRPTLVKPSASTGLLAEVDRCFTKWLSEHYDLDALHAMLATLAVQHLDGEPVWLLLIGGPGDAKTETVQSATGADAILVSEITSVGALLSGTSKKEQAADATGGLLRSLGDRGVLVIKDVTTILSMHRDARAALLAALREIYDGKWGRNLGTDGGRALTWAGRITVIGAVTTAWDEHYAAVSSMGDRFVSVRLDSTKNRLEKGLQALQNVGKEGPMRLELAAAIRQIVETINDRTKPVGPTDDERKRLLYAANLVTLGRTSVISDPKGEPMEAHMPEAVTRFPKQLLQIFRGACAIGMCREQALRLAVRCARDSMPPLRLAILECLPTAHMNAEEVAEALGKPRTPPCQDS